MDKPVEGDRRVVTSPSVPFKEHVDYQITEMRTKLNSLDDVGLKEYFSAILDEQRRGMVVAEQEREKAAKALRDELARSITDGDRALREHIEMQVHQIREALISADKLEMTRVESLEARVVNAQREVAIAFEASEKAILKAEIAAEKRFESVNEFRAQLADQSNSFLPRETFETMLSSLDKWRDNVEKRLNQEHGGKIAIERRGDQLRPWHIWVTGASVTVFVTVIVFIANILTKAG